jgi:apolipoprotein N-acyltransferase
VVPFSVGLPLLLIGMSQKSDGVKLAGIILCGFAGLAFAAMSAFLATAPLVVRMVGPIVILALGALLIVSALVRKPETPEATTKAE